MTPATVRALAGVAPTAGDHRRAVDSGPAAERLARVLFFAAGAAGIIFGLLSYGSFVQQIYAPIPAFSYVIWALVVGLTAVLCVFSHVFSLRALRMIAWAEAGVVLVNLVLWLLVRSEPLPSEFDVPWVITLTGVPAVCVAVVASSRVTWTYSLTVSILGGFLRAATTQYGDPVLIGVEDALYSILLQSLFIRLTIATRRRAVAQDMAAQEASTDGVRQAAQLGARQARLTMDALVHDSVMSTLLIAGRGQASAEVVARHSEQTLRKLDQFPTSSGADGHVTLPRLEQRLRALAHTVAPGTLVTSKIRPDGSVAANVAAAIEESAGEALRNSVAHAGGPDGRAVARSLAIREDTGGMRVEITDDGVGFDPGTVPSDRLGISQSIIGRMGSIRGGTAEVTAPAGSGARVVLVWTR